MYSTLRMYVWYSYHTMYVVYGTSRKVRLSPDLCPDCPSTYSTYTVVPVHVSNALVAGHSRPLKIASCIPWHCAICKSILQGWNHLGRREGKGRGKRTGNSDQRQRPLLPFSRSPYQELLVVNLSLSKKNKKSPFTNNEEGGRTGETSVLRTTSFFFFKLLAAEESKK